MSELTLQRIPFSVEADNRLRLLKSRTGITPNILCRIGLCLSFEEQRSPPLLPEGFQQGREINRYTLLGKEDQIYIALLLVLMKNNNIPFTRTNDMFLAHLHRGVELLATRIKSLSDFNNI